jgi:hypothetical protein
MEIEKSIAELELFNNNSIQEMGKSDITNFANSISEFITENGGEIIKTLAIATKYQLLFSEIEKNLSKTGINELLAYDNSKTNAFRVELQVAEVGTKYDFTANAKWNTIQEQINLLKEEQKNIEAFCKSLKSNTITVDEETGESFEFFPPAKSSTTSIKKTIK